MSSFYPFGDLFPPASVTAGDFILEFSEDDLSDTSPTWTDITSYWTGGGRFRRGVSDNQDLETGTATFVLDNGDRRFEPDYVAGAYYPNVRPLRRMRLSIDGEIQFTGHVTSWGNQWPDRYLDQQTVVECADGAILLNLEELDALDPPDATSYSDVVDFDEPSFYYRLGEDAGTKLVSHLRSRRWRRRHPNRPKRYRTRETRAELGGVSGPPGTYKNTPTLGEPGLILGDPGTAVSFTPGSLQYARVPLDDSDLIDRNKLTIECWVDTPSASQEHTFVAGPNSATVGDSVFWLGTDNTGTPRVRLEFTSDTSATRTGGSILAAGAHHLAATWDGHTLTLYVDGVSVSSGDAPGGQVLRAGSVADFLYIGRRASGVYAEGKIAHVAIYEKALSAERILAHYLAGSARGFAQELAGERVADLVTHDLWATTKVQDGDFEVVPRMKFGQAKLEEVQNTVSAEIPNNFFYFDAVNDPVYLGFEFAATSTYNTVQATFGENAGEVPYEDVAVVYDDEIANEVTVSTEDSGTHMAEDLDSQSEFRLRRLKETGLPLANEDDADTIAAAILDRVSQPQLRFTSLTLNGIDTDARTQILAREPGDLIRIKRRPGNGTAIDRVVRVLSKSVTIGGDGTLSATLQVDRGFDAAAGGWRLGIDDFSELGTGTVLA